MKKHEFIVEKAATGFSAYAEDFDTLPVGTTGATMTELKKNILEATNLYLEYIGKPAIAMGDVTVSLDLPQFFDYYKVINAKVLSSRIGINNTLLSQYVTGVKKPSEKQVQKILNGVRELGKELYELELA
jgi:hypothetical protein